MSGARPRAEIEKAADSWGNMHVPDCVMLEVLLDIRDLLMAQRDDAHPQGSP